MIRAIRIYLARRRLERLIRKRRDSAEIQQFTKRRAAMLKFTRGASA